MTTSQILLNLFFAVLGAVLGAFVSVIVAIKYSKYELKRFRESDRIELRRQLVKEFQSNIKGLEKMRGQLSSKPNIIIPDYRMDTESIAHILFHGRKLFDDEKWFDKFNHYRYQLCHINAQVDYLNEMTNLYDACQGPISATGSMGQQRYSSLVAHLEIIENEISKLIADYENNFQCNRQASVFSRIFLCKLPFLKFYRKWFWGRKP